MIFSVIPKKWKIASIWTISLQKKNMQYNHNLPRLEWYNWHVWWYDMVWYDVYDKWNTAISAIDKWWAIHDSLGFLKGGPHMISGRRPFQEILEMVHTNLNPNIGYRSHYKYPHCWLGFHNFGIKKQLVGKKKKHGKFPQQKWIPRTSHAIHFNRIFHWKTNHFWDTTNSNYDDITIGN